MVRRRSRNLASRASEQRPVRARTPSMSTTTGPGGSASNSVRGQPRTHARGFSAPHWSVRSPRTRQWPWRSLREWPHHRSWYEAVSASRAGRFLTHDHPLPSGAPSSLLGSYPQGGGDGATSEDPDRVHADVPHRGGLPGGALRAPLAAGLLVSPLRPRACLVSPWSRPLRVRQLPLPELPDRRHHSLLHTYRPAQVAARHLAARRPPEAALGARAGGPAP